MLERMVFAKEKLKSSTQPVLPLKAPAQLPENEWLKLSFYGKTSKIIDVSLIGRKKEASLAAGRPRGLVKR